MYIYRLDILSEQLADGNVSQQLQYVGFPGLGLGFRGYGNTTQNIIN